MLADTTLAERGKAIDRLTGGGVTALAEAIQKAGRFDVAPGVIVSAYAVQEEPDHVADPRLVSLSAPFRHDLVH